MFNTTTVNSQGFVYKWTYSPTGQFYIGIHNGTTDDGYIGSGLRFQRKWNKTEKSDWYRDILFEGDYYHDCVYHEAELVNDQTLKNPLCLNLQHGGRTGKRLRYFSTKKKSYRVKPQKVTLHGVKYHTGLQAIKSLNISFEELDLKLISAGWPCKYNDFNKN